MYTPIIDGSGEQVGVFQLFNKKDQEPFDKLDVLYFKTMANLVGQLLTNTNVAHDIMSLSGQLYCSIEKVLDMITQNEETIYTNP